MSLVVLAVCPAHTQTLNTLYSFCSQQNCTDGYGPAGNLAMDANGNLYGTTGYGGTSNWGTVYELTPSGTETVLYSFPGGSGGEGPGGVIRDTNGNLYGVTSLSGGTVFEITTDGTEKILYTFGAYSGDGTNPVGALVMDSAGNLYGTTASGGSNGSGNSYAGTVWELMPSGGTWTEKILYSFCQESKCTDGAAPAAGLVRDSNGNLYGTTSFGGITNSNCNTSCGVVFKIDPSGNETVLYSFAGGADGAEPEADLFRDSNGNLYGTTVNGGANGLGTVFEVSSSGSEQVLHSFAGAPGDGAYPVAGVTRDSQGNLYGTTTIGGTYNDGTVFELNAAGTETMLYSFVPRKAGEESAYPAGDLLMVNGNLFGTTEEFGFSGDGTVFEMTLITGGPAITISPTSVNFGDGVLNKTSAAQTVTATNTGTATVDIDSITIGGDFAISANTCGATLDTGASCSVNVTFTPKALGPLTGTLTFTDNAPNSPQTVALSGTGVKVLPVTLTPASATYPKQKVGRTSKPKTFTLTNKQPVTLTNIAISTTGDFAVSSTTCGASLAVKGKCTISVTFTPTETGTRTGKLQVSDSASNSPQVANLSGTGD
jgi:uncharacterized repeat protein (TIGR03803 family)